MTGNDNRATGQPIVVGTEPAAGAAAGLVVGRDLLPGGRFLRIFGGLLLLGAVAETAHHRGLGPESVLGQLIPTFLVVTVGYVILIGVLGERLMARDGWLAAMLLVAPAAVLSALPFVPDAVSAGFTLYLAVGMLVQAATGYGGCEVAGIPTLILRRRYRVYCAFSGADAAERRLQTRSAGVRWAAMLLTVLATVALFVLVAAVTPTWFQNYGEYLLFLAIGYVGSWIVRTTTALHSPSSSR